MSLFVFCLQMEEQEEAKNTAGKKQILKAWWQPSLVIFARFSSWIFGPVVIALFIGKWLDKKFGVEPVLLLITVGLAFIVSVAGLLKTAKEEYKKAGEKDRDKQNKDNK